MRCGGHAAIRAVSWGVPPRRLGGEPFLALPERTSRVLNSPNSPALRGTAEVGEIQHAGLVAAQAVGVRDLKRGGPPEGGQPALAALAANAKGVNKAVGSVWADGMGSECGDGSGAMSGRRWVRRWTTATATGCTPCKPLTWWLPRVRGGVSPQVDCGTHWLGFSVRALRLLAGLRDEGGSTKGSHVEADRPAVSARYCPGVVPNSRLKACERAYGVP